MIYDKDIYNKISNIIDNYLKKISIKNLRAYLKNKKNFLTFKEKHNIDYTNVYNIIMTILDDRELYNNMNTINEDINNIEYEKILSDYYNISIGHIEVGKSKNSYILTDFDYQKIVYIYNKVDLEKIKNILINKMFSDIKEKNIITDFKFFKAIDSIKLNISDFINYESVRQYLNEMMDDNNVIKYISQMYNIKYIEKHKGYYIFEK